MKLTRRGKIVAAVGVPVAVALVLTIPGYLYLRSIAVFGESDPGEKVDIVIPEGATAEDVAELLEDRGIIPSAFGFRVVVLLEGGGGDIEAGKYSIARGLTPRDALEVLREGASVDFVSVTFPEGSWLTDFAAILDENTHISGRRFLAVVQNARVRSRLLPPGVDTLEGLLFPSTYQIVDDDTARSVAARLVAEFEEQAAAAGISTARRLGLTPYEAVIVASMIEAEAKIPGERAKVARVMYNRLEQGIALGIDATVNYAIGEHKLDLTLEELAVESPYNTRTHKGLPPTPIGAPGRAALEAALRPASGEWLYYVLADCRGRHAFSTSYDEFLDDKAAYQARDCG